MVLATVFFLLAGLILAGLILVVLRVTKHI